MEEMKRVLEELSTSSDQSEEMQVVRGELERTQEELKIKRRKNWKYLKKS